MLAAGAASAVDTSDKDRLMRNFTRETASVEEGKFRLETKGFLVWNQTDPTLNMAGFPLPKNAESLTGGTLALLATYGFMRGAEGGFQITGVWQSLQSTPTNTYDNTADVGDFLMYAKIGRPLKELINLSEDNAEIGEMVHVGGGLEMTMPNGPTSKGAGSGAFGANPYLSTRVSRGPWAVMSHLGYFFYTPNAPNVFNYDLSGIFRVTDLWAFRLEWSGRVLQSGGTLWDAVLLPGLDVRLSDMFTVRPTGLVGASSDAPQYGIGVGIAAVF